MSWCPGTGDGDPFTGEWKPSNWRRTARSLPTSPEREAAAVAVGEGLSALSIHRPHMARPERARVDHDDFIVAEMIGVRAPAPIEDFQEVGLSAAARRDAGYEFPTLLQRFAIPVLMARRDLWVASSTKSTGKTAAFCLPVVTGIFQAGPRIGGAKPRAVILAPTIARAIQVTEEAKKYAYNTHISVVKVVGGTPMFLQELCTVG